MLARLLPIQGLQDQALAEAISLSTRWDVPRGNEVPEDLADINGRYFRTSPDANGRQTRISGRMLVDDLHTGSASAAIPIIFGLMAVAGILAVMLGKPWAFIPLVPLLFLVGTSTNGKGGLIWAIASVVLAVGLPALGQVGLGSISLLKSGGATPLICVAALIGGALLFGGLRGARMLLQSIAALAAVIGIAALTPVALRPFVLALPACLLPVLWSETQVFARGRLLEAQGRKATFEDTERPVKHVEGRKQQAERAAKDTSPLITWGTAMGEMTARWDGFAPDAGLPVRSSVNDLATHLLVLGSTGRGKTSAVLNPLMAAYIAAGVGGSLTMDGKGSLAVLYRRVKNYLLIDPRRCVVGLYEGMSPAEVANCWKELNTPKDDHNPFFTTSAGTACRHTAEVLRALVDITADGPEEEKWHWTVHHHFRLAQLGLAAGADAKTSMHQFLDNVWLKHPKGQVGLLADARQYFLVELEGLDEKPLSSIAATVSSWFSPILSHKDLLVWGQAETGVRVEECLHGRHVGINLPTTVFGHAGTVATRFLKNRVFNEGKRRAEAPEGDWRAMDPTAKPCLLLMDECQLIFGEPDMDLIPIGRSLGLWFVCCTQTIESMRTIARDQHKIGAALDSFQSVIALRSSPETTQWLVSRFGMTWMPQFVTGGVGIDFVGSVAQASDAPLYDPTNPQARVMRWLRRLGAGSFRPIAFATDGGREGMGGSADHLRFSMITTAGKGWAEEPLLSKATFEAITAQQGTALCSLTRGGSPRRDFIRLDRHMDRLPEDLCDPDVPSDPELDAPADEAPDAFGPDEASTFNEVSA